LLTTPYAGRDDLNTEIRMRNIEKPLESDNFDRTILHRMIKNKRNGGQPQVYDHLPRLGGSGIRDRRQDRAMNGASTSSEEPRGVNMNKTGFDRYE